MQWLIKLSQKRNAQEFTQKTDIPTIKMVSIIVELNIEDKEDEIN